MYNRQQRSLFLLLLSLIVAAPATLFGAEDRVLYDRESRYNRIIVEEDDFHVRRLYFEPQGAVQTAIDMEEPLRLILPYARTTMCGLALVPQPKRMLIVGLGGGCMPMFLRDRYPDAQIDVAELDLDVARVAKAYFEFREDAKLKVHIGDGRKFIETTENRYDIIFLDAYGTDEIPYSLTTREFLRAVRSKLSESGIVVANVWGSYDNKLYPSMVKTYRDVFAELHIVCAPRSENRIFLALPKKAGLSKEQLAEKAGELQKARPFKFDLAEIVQGGYEPLKDNPDAKVLLDGPEPKTEKGEGNRKRDGSSSVHPLARNALTGGVVQGTGLHLIEQQPHASVIQRRPIFADLKRLNVLHALPRRPVARR